MRASLLILAMIGASRLWAGEYAVLASGFRLRAERHVAEGATTTLYDRDGSYTAVPTASILSFEAEDYAPPAATAPETKPPSPPDAAAAAGSLQALIQKVAQQYHVSPELVESVIAAESAYNPAAVSPKGAVGLMQLMPGTARDLRVTDRRDAAQNVEGGTAYLKQLLDRYAGFDNQFERAVAAYNAGPAKVDRYGGLPPYRETVDFVARVSTRLSALAAAR
ncbi:MAG TPA: lytic transglycosylase domain-containing protein [Bryobacterales bacterium]|nr:lytic transglycosylase domain-containing protein [Bryobacterales bacterium]